VNIAAKFEVCSFTHSGDNRGYSQNLGSPWIRTRSFFSEIFNGLLFGWTLNISAKFEVRSFTRSWDNRGHSKNLGRTWIRPRSFFFKIFHGLVFRCTLRIYLPNLKSLALAVTEKNVKKTYQLKTQCKDDVLISDIQNGKNHLGEP